MPFSWAAANCKYFTGLLLLQETWKHAIEKAKHMPDPWAEFHLEDIETEHATRYRSGGFLLLMLK